MKPYCQFLFLCLIAGLLPLQAETTLDPAHHDAYGANIGWINGEADQTHGMVVGEYTCSGYLYAANIGWINLGDASPADGIRYSNTGGDFGVNRLGDGRLRGYAWSANTGWIQFEEQGNPRVDLATGVFSGYAYGANIGWIALAGVDYYVKTLTVKPSADTDSDGIGAWELEQVGSLTPLAALNDRDGDGVLDAEEYAADTDPDDNQDFFRITSVEYLSGSDEISLTWTARSTRLYQILTSDNLLTWATGSVMSGDASGTMTRQIDFSTPGGTFYRVKAQSPAQ